MKVLASAACADAHPRDADAGTTGGSVEADAAGPAADAEVMSEDAEEEAESTRDAAAPEVELDAGSALDAAAVDVVDAASTQRDAGLSPLESGVPDAGALDAATNSEADSATLDATADSGGDSAAPAACACHAPTPVCVDGRCVACGAGQPGACAPLERCDEASHTCVDNRPFRLDCAHLPEGRACQGGPREVILGAHTNGFVAMFDPQDGHFLGWLSRRSIPLDREQGLLRPYYFAGQGPDQCIWTVVSNGTGSGSHAVDRLNPDGTFKDAIIPTEKHYEKDTNGIYQPVIETVRSIAFTDDKVYVASTRGEPNARVSRFSLAGDFEAVVLDDGSRVESLLVLQDGSLLIANATSGHVEQLTPDLRERRVVASPVEPGQLSWADPTSILAVDTQFPGGGKVYKVDLATGQEQSVLPLQYNQSGRPTPQGVAPLGNGRWLVSLDYLFGVRSLDPSSASPAGQHSAVMPPDPSTPDIWSFRHFGRACLSDAFVRSRELAADPPLTSCAAPAGPAHFVADFEQGMDGFEPFNEPWTTPYATVTVSREAVDGDVALKIEGGVHFQQDWAAVPTGVFVDGLDYPASFIEYSLRVANPFLAQAYFSFNAKEKGEHLEHVWVQDGLLTSSEAGEAAARIVQDWVRVQLRDINWVHGTYDLYVSRPGADEVCTRIGNDIAFSRWAMTGRDRLKQLQLFNADDRAVAWFDDIVVK